MGTCGNIYLDNYQNRCGGDSISLDNTFKAMSNPVRGEILSLLREKDLTASEIAGHFNLSNATISHHLSSLKKSGLIDERKHKNYIIYSINTSVVEDMMSFLAKLIGGEKHEKNR